MRDLMDIGEQEIQSQQIMAQMTWQKAQLSCQNKTGQLLRGLKKKRKVDDEFT